MTGHRIKIVSINRETGRTQMGCTCGWRCDYLRFPTDKQAESDHNLMCSIERNGVDDSRIIELRQRVRKCKLESEDLSHMIVEISKRLKEVQVEHGQLVNRVEKLRRKNRERA